MTASTAEPRQLNNEEVRAQFLETLAGIVSYWEGQTEQTVRERLNGTVFSTLVLLDGGNAGMPGFCVSPAPHPEDEAYCREHGENWFPRAEPDPHDIAGGLHARWHKFSPDERPDAETGEPLVGRQGHTRPHDVELETLIIWPPGTVGEQRERTALHVLRDMCEQLGYGRVPQLAAQLAAVWRDPRAAGRYQRSKEERLVQMESDREAVRRAGGEVPPL